MFDNLPVFPSFPGLTWPMVKKNSGFKVIKHESIAGRRLRRPTRFQNQYEWSLPISVLNGISIPRTTIFSDGTRFSDLTQFIDTPSNYLHMLMGFYSLRYGDAYPFLFFDNTDNAVTDQLVAYGDDHQTQFQLVRSYGGFTDPVYKLKTLVNVKINGVALSNTSYSIDSLGKLTLFVPPVWGASITWSGSFYWIVRFENSTLEFSQTDISRWSVENLKFSSEII